MTAAARNSTAVTRERIEQLEEEVAYWRAETQAILDRDFAARLSKCYGLDPACARLLSALYQAKGRVLDKDRLTEMIGSRDESGKSVQVRVCQTRRRLGHGVIETFVGYGYRIGPSGVKAVEDLRA